MAKTQEKNLKGAKIKTKVFISYSRRNIDWADWLVEQLTDQGIEVLIDRQDIVPGEAWEPRIYSLIDQADTVIFLISSASVNSGICHQEVDYAESLNKRFVPLLLEDPLNEEGKKTAVPEALQKINYIFFNKGSDSNKSLKDLVQALLVDIHWVREHTRIGELAQRWEKAGLPSSQLLRGKDLEAAEKWRDHPHKDTRPPTELQLRYIAACRKGAGKRRNMLMGSLVAGLVVAVGLGGLAFWQREEALRNKSQAEQNLDLAKKNEAAAVKSQIEEKKQRQLAETNEIRAKKNEKKADEELKKSQLSQSKFLTKQVANLIENNNEKNTLYALLLIEALPDLEHQKVSERTRPFWALAHFYLHKISQFFRGQYTLPTFIGTGTSISLSPDNRIIAVASDKNVNLWDSKSKKHLARLEWSVDYNTDITFSHDNQLIAASSGCQFEDAPCQISVWNTNTYKRVALIYPDIESDIRSIAFSFDNSEIIFGDDVGGIRIWNIITDKIIDEYNIHSRGVYFIGLSADGEKIISGSADNTIQVWDKIKKKQIAEMKGHERYVLSVSYSPGGKYIVSGAGDNNIIIWNAKTYRKVTSFKLHDGEVSSVMFSPDGENIISGSDQDNTIRVWNIEKQKQIMVIRAQVGSNLELISDSQEIIYGTDFGSLKILKLKEPNNKFVKGHENGVSSVSISPNGKKIVSGSFDNKIKIWKINNLGAIGTLTGHNSILKLDADREPIQSKGVLSVAFSPNGHFIASSAIDGTIRLWDAKTYQPVGSTKINKTQINKIFFSPDSKTIVSSSGGIFEIGNSNIQIWDAKNLRQLGLLKESTTLYSDVVISPDSRLIAASSWDRAIRIWDAKSHQLLMAIIGHEHLINSVAFSPDSKILISGSSDNSIRVWDVKKKDKLTVSNKSLAVLKGPESSVSSVSFSTDGKLIISSYSDSSILLWDAHTKQQLAAFKGHEGNVNSIVFSPDDKFIISGGDDKTIRIWDVILKQNLIEHMKKKVGRCLTQSERDNYFLSSEPPRWCITGVGLEREKKSYKWKPKWPYHTEVWKKWLIAKDAGKKIPVPVE